MTKRAIADEIARYRAHLLPGHRRFLQVHPRLLALDGLRKHADDLAVQGSPLAAELFKYFPIGYVACIESMARLVCRDLIDRDPTCRRNVTRFRDLRFGTEHVLDIHAGTLTLGEFVSHLLPFSSLEDINASISLLLDEDFLQLVVRVPITDDGQNLKDRGHEVEVFRSVQRLFELRHTLAHEAAPVVVVNHDELRVLGPAGGLFVALGSLAANQRGGE